MQKIEQKEIKVKSEVKEGEISSLIQFGMGKIMKESLCDGVKEEKESVEHNSGTKPEILVSLVKSCAGMYEDDPKLTQMNATIKLVKVELLEEKYKLYGGYLKKEENESKEKIEDSYHEDYESDKRHNLAHHTDSLTTVDSQSISLLPDQVKGKNMSNYKKKGKFMCKGKNMSIYRKKGKYVCIYCDKWVTLKDSLRRHMKLHIEGKSFECTFCCKRFSSKQDLKHHESNHTGIKPFSCSICGKRFSRRSSVRTHMLLHEEVKAFKCDICEKDFRQRGNLTQHLRKVHKQIEKKTGINSVSRDVCDESFPLQNDSLEHSTNSHSTCNECGKEFKHKNNLATHMKQNHIPGQCRFICKICGRSVTTKSGLKLHEKVHENIYRFKCEICFVVFKRKLSLKCHLESVHGTEKPFKCAQCDSSFKKMGNLSAHIEVHHNNSDKVFSCHICSSNFKRKTYLKRHLMSHTGADKKLICNDCGLGFRSKFDIRRHVLMHLGLVEKTHACEICGKKFCSPTHARRHQNAVHSDKKPFPCELCDRAFKSTNALKRHRETDHFGATFSCNNCDYTNKSRRSLERHLKKYHS